MADITMCVNKQCPKKDCYRKTAPLSYPQSVAMFQYRTTATGYECDNYYPPRVIELREGREGRVNGNR